MPEQFRAWWCRSFHDSITWPIHGHYTCATCHRQISVAWEKNRFPDSRPSRIGGSWDALRGLISHLIPGMETMRPAVCAIPARTARVPGSQTGRPAQRRE